MRRTTLVALSCATLLVCGGYYAVADTLDLVPGPLTAAHDDVVSAPLPTIQPPDSEPLVPAVTGLNPQAPVPTQSALAAITAGLKSHSGLEGATVGVSVIDVLTGKEIFSDGGDTPLTPASSNKLLTAWAALTLMGPEHTLQTTATLSGSTVTLVGGGDVLLAPDAGNPFTTEGHAGLGDLAKQTSVALKDQGITTVTLALDDTLFSGPSWNSAWIEDYHAWEAPVQPIMLNVTDYHHAGGYPTDPAMDAAQTFAERLRENGITVTGSPVRKRSPQDAQTVGTITSAPLGDILAISLKTSDNTMTEVEGRLVALASGLPGSFAGATEAVLAQLSKQGFTTTNVTMLDCSGLAEGNKVPPALMAQIVSTAAGAPQVEGKTADPAIAEAGRTLITDLPISALDGTLSQRYNDSSAAGMIRAKTGSLDQVASLTGLTITADGRQLAFSVVANGFPEGGLWGARTAIDYAFMEPLTECGCS
ncbi:D-alanyl-D-alanine carboxypeptidase/D-alanyl-D-alanine endopeptidase [Actinomyces vulturis]|uniref:D-alanyl-D-alanine carboxypeptidase/D-alanyl-D-alanine endopeptidase n=1 Tax=Actinomyces vulturis TaxID=1857645 RepID=UPI00082B1CD7|nr:D-alanyl-D-alanine carboxypeptidase/D-alanyl-D-alanine-endopeptidase [Actinomyces vulturis]